MVSTALDVVAAIILDRSDRVLLSQRPAHKHQGGCWEFPGGKMEAGESFHQALARELHEELGIDITASTPFMTIHHDYPDLSVRLHFRTVRQWLGEPHGREQQPVDWFGVDALEKLTFPAANRPVVTALRLPDRWLVLPDDYRQQDWQARLRALSGRQVGGVYLRGAATADVPSLVTQCRELGLKTLVRDDVSLALASGADGVHLSASAAQQFHQHPAQLGTRLLSVACHNEDELQHATTLAADMVMLSPVHTTATHSHATPLGWPGFAALASGRPCAVYALGGVGADQFDCAREHGARGIAAIRAFW